MVKTGFSWFFSGAILVERGASVVKSGVKWGKVVPFWSRPSVVVGKSGQKWAELGLLWTKVGRTFFGPGQVWKKVGKSGASSVLFWSKSGQIWCEPEFWSFKIILYSENALFWGPKSASASSQRLYTEPCHSVWVFLKKWPRDNACCTKKGQRRICPWPSAFKN